MPAQPVRVASFFRTKRQGMLVGGCKAGDELNGLIAVIKEAIAANVGVTFFLFTNDKPTGPVAGMTATLERPREQGGRTGGGNAAPAGQFNPKPKPKANALDSLFGGEEEAPAQPEGKPNLGW